MTKDFDGAAISKADRDFLDSLGEHPLARHPLYGAPYPIQPDFGSLEPPAREAFFADVVNWLLVNYAYCKHAFKGRGGVLSLVNGKEISFASLRDDVLPYALEWEGKLGGQHMSAPADLWRKHPQRPRIDHTGMRPNRRRPTFAEDGVEVFNAYRPPQHPKSGGDIAVFEAFLARLIPDAGERAWFWHWLCHKARRPWVPMVAVIMVAEAFGSGRGTLCDVLEQVFGTDYVWPCPFGDLTGTAASARFNAQMAKALIIVVNEATEEEGPSQVQRRRVFETLKLVIDPSPTLRRRFEAKFKDADAQPSCASVIIATQHPDAIKLPKDDRRFSVVTCGAPMTVGDRETLRAWMAEPANIGALHRALIEAPAMPLDVFDPYGVPPPFAGRLDMIDLAASRMEEAAEAAIAALDGLPLMTLTQGARLVGFFGAYANASGNWNDLARHAVSKIVRRLRRRNEPENRIVYRKAQEIVYALTLDLRRQWRPADKAMIEAALDRTEARVLQIVGGSGGGVQGLEGLARLRAEPDDGDAAASGDNEAG